MRSRLLLPLAVLIAASALATSAGADTFIVVKSGAAPSSSGSAAASGLPSASFPNFPGSVAFPPNLSQPPAQPITLDQTQLLALWQSAGAAYGIPWPVLAAINEVESGFGRNMGPSSAGAIGWMQFMPSTWQEWGVDADGNGVADPWNPYDAVYAAARYLAASGGTTDISRAIFSYNHASWYVQDVLRIAQTFSQGQDVTLTAATPTAATLQPDLSGPRRSVAAAGRRAASAREAVRKLRTRIARLERRSNHVTLLSTGLAMQALAGRLRERLPAAQERVGQAQAALKQAKQALQQAQAEAKAQAQAQAQAASLAAAAQPMVSAPYANFAGGGWGVFSASNYAGTDQGVDFTGSGPIPALAAARVTGIRSESIIEGGSYPVVAYQLEDGPYAGSYVYVMENFTPTVHVGEQLSRGQTVGIASGRYPYIEVGFASGPDGSAAAPLYPDPHGAKAEGATMWSYIQSLLGDPPAGPGQTLLAVTHPAAAASTPVFRVVPMRPQQSVVYFSAS
jgi:hypothetical protein